MIAFLHRLVHPITSRVSLAVRVALLTTAAMAATLAAASALVYVVVENEFIGSLDESMIQRAKDAVKQGYQPDAHPDPTSTVSGIVVLRVQSGRLFADVAGNQAIPYDHREIEVSIGQADSSARTALVGGMPYRVVAVPAGRGQALVLAQPMDSVHDGLARLRIILLLVSTAGVVVGGLAGWIVATNGLRPVRRLTAATERVARTADLRPIEVHGRDELARLTTSFNQMLLALDASQERQRQLVADAGHELRTPLTSLRTNIELLSQASSTGRGLSPDQRDEILADVRAQTEELTTLVGDLVELARDEPMPQNPEPMDLADVVESALQRVRLRAPGLTHDVELSPWWVVGEPRSLERAVTNLLDNAAKWSPDDGTVTVRLREGELTITDQGPGIAADDLPHVFDRFYRSSEARTLPGSGLGLSIVRRAAERHGGRVEVRSTPGEGSTFTLVIPGDDKVSTRHTSLSDASQ